MSTKEYVDKYAISYVLGCVIKEPRLLKEYTLNTEDFTEKFHKILFASINNLMKKGIENLDSIVIDEYISQFSEQYRIFEKNNGIDYIDKILEISDSSNIKYYYDRIKKFSLLRRYETEGISVKEFYDPKEVDPVSIENKNDKLEKSSCLDIINHFKKKQLLISGDFKKDENRQSKRAGVGGAEQLARWEETTSWGIGYASSYLTTTLHGLRKGRFTVKSAGTGVGKTRTTIADICSSCAPKIYNLKTKKWETNVNGQQNGCLYIGTEMELMTEIEPIIWAYMSGVPQENIEFATYEEGEKERVLEAIDILEKEGRIWLEYIPEYDVSILRDTIEFHKINHNISHVFFDYIHTTVELIGEYADESKVKMATREDQVLSNLSNKLKNMCREFEVSIDTCTQISGDFKNTENRDQTIVRGAKAIIDKADGAMIAMPPTTKELSLVEDITRNLFGEDGRVPNLVYSVYKNRGGKWNNIKIWLYVDYDTMRTYDLFVTDYKYKIIDNIDKTIIKASDLNEG